jgi:cytochrome b
MTLGLAFRWDLFTRLWHAALAGCVLTALISGWLGGAWMALHAIAGYGVLLLLLLRLVWGFVGPEPSRWSTLLRSLATLARPGRPLAVAAGHNPLGAGSVLVLLVWLLVQASLGLFTDDEIGFQGPLSTFIHADLSLQLTGWHRLIGPWLWAWLAAHLLAMAVHHLALRDPLLKRMALSWRWGVVLALFAIGLVAWQWPGGLPQSQPAVVPVPAGSASAPAAW